MNNEEELVVKDKVYYEMENKCGKCSEKLGTFITYVPGMGESCTKCLMSSTSIVWADGKKHSKRVNHKVHSS